jgi:signal transduction histidine kinase
VHRAAKVEQRVIAILIGSASLGVILCIGGLLGMRRWVMLPVSDLRVATEQISKGHFEHRVQPRSAYELGQLALNVNQMCATIVEIQKRLIEKERLAAAGEMVTHVAHNIKNPLSAMRLLAEATARRVSQDQASIDNLRQIVNSIDSFVQWLRDLQQSVTPLTITSQCVDIRAMINRVASAVHGMAIARQIDLSINVSPEVHWVRVDPFHFEQAVAALLTNAVQASPAGERVTLSVRPVLERSSEWELIVEDHGPGIQPELLEKIFLPYFTTKADGTGLGLDIAQKVVRFHGGELKVESRVGHGSRFVAVVPGRTPA